MVDVATCAVASTYTVALAVVCGHILASLLHGALDAELLHIGVGRYLRLDMMALEHKGNREGDGEKSHGADCKKYND